MYLQINPGELPLLDMHKLLALSVLKEEKSLNFLGDFFQGNSAQTNCLNIFRKFYFFN
jgi:hypothetical protein